MSPRTELRELYPFAGCGGPDGSCEATKLSGVPCGADGRYDGYHNAILCGTHFLLAEERDRKPGLGRKRFPTAFWLRERAA